MVTPFDIYLIGLVGDLCPFFFVLTVFFLGLSLSAYHDSTKNIENSEKDEKAAIQSLWICLFFMVSTVLIPSSKTLAAMYVLPPVLKSVQGNKQIQQIPQAVLDLIKSYESKDDDKK